MVIGSSHKHRDITLNEFSGLYLNDILDKLSKENKTVFLLGDIA